MRRIRYSKYVPDPAGEMSLEDLLGALSDYLLRSGFQENMWYEMPDGEQTMDALRRAIEQALLNGELFDEEMRERLDQTCRGAEERSLQSTRSRRQPSARATHRWTVNRLT